MEQLTKGQRCTIPVMHKQGFQQKEIATTINKHESVASREPKRNCNKHGTYSYSHAQMLADVRKERIGQPRTFTCEMKNRINHCMRQRQWSPEQMAGHCKPKGCNMVSFQVGAVNYHRNQVFKSWVTFCLLSILSSRTNCK